MGRNALVILVLPTLALGGGALYVPGDSAGTSAGSSVASWGTAPAALGAPLLPQLKAAEVAPITILEPKVSLTLEKKNDRWVIAERGDYPADLDKVLGDGGFVMLPADAARVIVVSEPLKQATAASKERVTSCR